MAEFTVSLSLTTNDDCEGVNEAVDYFIGQIQEGIYLTVRNESTGVESEEYSR